MGSGDWRERRHKQEWTESFEILSPSSRTNAQRLIAKAKKEEDEELKGRRANRPHCGESQWPHGERGPHSS
jgi:hypothetical protein